jgi:hypothetical protein
VKWSSSAVLVGTKGRVHGGKGMQQRVETRGRIHMHIHVCSHIPLQLGTNTLPDSGVAGLAQMQHPQVNPDAKHADRADSAA